MTRITFDSSDKKLTEAFNWAKEQALSYVNYGDSVGDWYEAALPNRKSFCMRDVFHQSMGAHFLGLQHITKNMLNKFVENISSSRDWCTYWEINLNNEPCKVDYTNDDDFWYNLPANFELINCCYNQYLWTGNLDYINGESYLYFYNKTLNDYINHWDKDGDGFIEFNEDNGRRGIASYNEDKKNQDALLIADMLAAQYTGAKTYSKILTLNHDYEKAYDYQEQAKGIKEIYNTDWYNGNTKSFYSIKNRDGIYTDTYVGICNTMPLRFDLVDTLYIQEVLDFIYEKGAYNVEELSYFPELFYKYGSTKKGYELLLKLSDPQLKRRDYPEVSYSVIATIVLGVMGVKADYNYRTVSTIGQLNDTGYGKLENVPVFNNHISIHHEGSSSSTLKNISGEPLYWKAIFKERKDKVWVNDKPYMMIYEKDSLGQEYSYVTLLVKEGCEYNIRVI